MIKATGGYSTEEMHSSVTTYYCFVMLSVKKNQGQSISSGNKYCIIQGLDLRLCSVFFLF